ncbi:FMN-dependent oxidoreductase (nitrilotriacetate monooxygenase family) [Pseudoduganella lurida]|uniref:FMN-dependent oxidoreductase (Nitrilotriacetate monooxygenase family) n=1 Tax=Pseudoduganella lurida TaxID=1036180 RepID=A0A562QWQ1_9BURK|nr:LLM class flavin-dependent oxidoreductase [Pseudoduganella lurida]TWI61229.1 FMN-dependent oxidoreductase (nitrilotriacetate monooxygenase family) [Pseudoduganella lurida]
MAASTRRQLSLTAFLMRHGHHVAAWRHPDTDLSSPPFEVIRQQVQSAERACLDAVFFADSVALTGAPSLEPLTMLAALAAVTSRIGLIATATTTYNEPYTVARQFASLDSISNGRAGWNLVTSDNAAEAANFGRDRHVDHAVRYARAREFQEVVKGLWNSYGDGAFVNDKAAGRLLDNAHVHRLDYRGEHFSVAGPLNVPPSPQGRPVVVQAGSSETGRDLAAATADVVFTAQPSLAGSQAFYRDMKGRLAGYGRAADSLRVTPGIFAVVGESVGEAQDKFGVLQDLIEPQAGLALLGRMIGNFDLSGYPLDGPLPELPVTQDGQRSRQQLLTSIAQGENLTIRQLYQRIAGGRGHFTVIGTAAQIADQMQQWFEEGGADGFNLMPPALPGGLDDLLAQVVPELQRRGLFRTAYEGSTLRSHFGLPAPD